MNSNQNKHVHPFGLAGGLLLSSLFGVFLLLPLSSRAQPTILSYSNSAPITINDSFSDSDPYPSTISVPAVGGALQSLTVTLTGLTNPSTAGIELLLVGPSGVGVDLMYLAGNGAAGPINLVIADGGTPFPNATLTSGTYQPSGTAYPSGNSFPGYSPFAGEDTTNKLIGYAGTPLSGTWSLYGYDTDFAGTGSITGGWGLTFTVVTTTPTATTLAATGVMATNATLNAIVNDNGSATTAYFDYGTTTAYGQTTPTTSISVGAGPLTITNVVALAPNTLYHFRVTAQNSSGITHGNDLTFTTTAPVVPPTLAMSLTNQTMALLTLFGNAGSNYVILAATNLNPPVTWQPILTNSLIGTTTNFNLGPATNLMQYFRAAQQ